MACSDPCTQLLELPLQPTGLKVAEAQSRAHYGQRHDVALVHGCDADEGRPPAPTPLRLYVRLIGLNGSGQRVAALDRTSQAVRQGPPCIGDGRAVQHPCAADSTHPPRHATALPGQLPAGSWGHFRARKSIDGANKQAPRASEARSARQGAAASGIKSRPPGRARRRRRLDAQHQSPTRTPGRRTPRLYRCHRSSSLSVGQAESLRGLAPTPITSPRQKCLPRGGQPVPRIDDPEAPPQCYSAHHPDPGNPP